MEGARAAGPVGREVVGVGPGLTCGRHAMGFPPGPFLGKRMFSRSILASQTIPTMNTTVTNGGRTESSQARRPSIDNVITLCEMNGSVAPVGIGILKEVERKVELLQAEFPSKTIQRVLVAHGRPSRELSQSGCFYRVITSRNLVGRAHNPSWQFVARLCVPRGNPASPGRTAGAGVLRGGRPRPRR